tara:strand:+ start:390 stop:713 length:324 start_codon:yes stop_codon:yes gene_type:complete
MIFMLLFVLHIVFAANDYHLLFRVVALLITVMTFFSGPIFMFIEPSQDRYRTIYIQGLVISIPLSIGLGWAYSGMSLGLEMILFPLITLFIHGTIRQSSIGLTYGLK